MPLVRIDLADTYDEAQAAAIASAIHKAVVDVLRIPVRDRFQIINRLPSSAIIAQDAGLGFERSAGVLMIQIFTQRGRSSETKSELFAAIAEHLAELGVAGEDVFIGYQENGPDDWSFGFGRAQYMTGELRIPKAAS